MFWSLFETDSLTLGEFVWGANILSTRSNTAILGFYF